MIEFEPTNRRSIYLNGRTTTKDMSDFEVSLIDEIERLREVIELYEDSRLADEYLKLRGAYKRILEKFSNKGF